MDKKSLVGETTKIHATYEHEPDSRLKQPLEPGAVINAMCQGCGTVFGMGSEEAMGLLDLLSEAPQAESFAGSYFHISVCPFCDGEQSFAELRPIPENV